MTKQELIQYLQACYEAEQGLHESRRTIALLQQKSDELSERYFSGALPNVSAPPVMEKLQSEYVETYKDLERWHKGELLDSILSLDLKRIALYKRVVKSDRESNARKDEIQARRRQENQAKKDRYAVALAEWEAKNYDYQQLIRYMAQYTISSISDERERCEASASAFQNALDRLYAMDILHAEFRHAEAVYQLKQYLEMGVAEQLAGPDGACRLYLEELRAQRVVGSIDRLRDTVERGFQQVTEGQKALYAELQQVKASYDALSSEVDRRLTDISLRISEVSQSVADGVAQLANSQESCAQAMRDEWEGVRRVIETSAYNQYIVDRKQHVNDYLGYVLRNPLL